VSKARVIPCLLLRNGGLVKTIKFSTPKYIGDAINTVRIYNEKEVDELIFLDITATPNNKEPNYKVIAEIASECFMPFAYGGGVTSFDQAKKILNLGAEKIALNSITYTKPKLVTEIADHFGSQSVIASIDVKKTWRGKEVIRSHSGKKKHCIEIVEHVKKMADIGAGEILLTSIDQDGVMQGYDCELIEKVSAAVDIPVIACGGAGCINDFFKAIKHGASAVASGSMMVYQGKNRSVLIGYPERREIIGILG
jgi:imidazole glycerol-phosphate synthase subunit HisF